MRVGSVSNAYASKIVNKNQKQNTSFKADVRIVENQFDSSQLPPAYHKRLNEVFNHLLTDFQNVGDDNTLFLLRPVLNGKTSKKQMEASIEIRYGYKDPEKARRNILKNLKNPEFVKEHLSHREPEEIKRDIELLEKRDPGFMNYLRSIHKSSNQPAASHYIFTEVPLKEYDYYIDRTMNFDSESMSYEVYKEDEVLDVGDVNKKTPLWDEIKGYFRTDNQHCFGP